MNDRVQHPTVTWLYNMASKIRNDFSRFYRDTEKDRIRFNFGETPFSYTFKIKFTPSHRVIKFIVSKDPDIDTIECQLYEKTNNIIRDIDQIYYLVNQEYLPTNKSDENTFSLIMKLWHWGCVIRPDRKNDIYKVHAKWYSPQPKYEDVLYIGVIKSVKHIETTPPSFASMDLKHAVNDPTVKLQLELMTPQSTYDYFIEVIEGLEKNIYPGQLFILNWMERFSIMRFTPAKHHISFNSEQYGFISDYISKEIKDGYKSRKED